MSNSISCLIVDDEPSAQQILKQYISDAPNLTSVGSCNDALEAIEFLKGHSVDLLFLDINMPKLSGISFLKSVDDIPEVILTTAYDDYALESYELDVIDYLLKPFSFERFLKATEKAKEKLTKDHLEDRKINIKSNGKIYRINISDIHYIKSLGDYVSIYTSDQKFVTLGTLKKLEKELNGSNFLRVHRSFIVSIPHVDFWEGNLLNINKTQIPIGNTYKDEVKKKFSF
ncbi:MAG: LytTR family DNA-binding domain-containing protein [Balneolaceae bacterium]|nr:LytTR family DNA-binding domain-containing protein [Balneolaceae bacterium]